MAKKKTPAAPGPGDSGKSPTPPAVSPEDVLKLLKLLKLLGVVDITTMLKVFGVFDLTAAQIVDSTGDPHTLASGIALKAGLIKVTGVKLLPNPDSSPNTNPVSAVIISDDESVYLTSTPHSTQASVADPVVWDFTWASVPAIGLAVVRLTELSTDLTNPGSISTFSISIYEDLDSDPVVVGVDTKQA